MKNARQWLLLLLDMVKWFYDYVSRGLCMNSSINLNLFTVKVCRLRLIIVLNRQIPFLCFFILKIRHHKLVFNFKIHVEFFFSALNFNESLNHSFYIWLRKILRFCPWMEVDLSTNYTLFVTHRIFCPFQYYISIKFHWWTSLTIPFLWKSRIFFLIVNRIFLRLCDNFYMISHSNTMKEVRIVCVRILWAPNNKFYAFFVVVKRPNHHQGNWSYERRW